MTYKLREHQSTAIELLRKSLATGHRTPVLQAATGFGKTLIAIDIIKSALAKGKRVMFVVDRVTLIDQTSKEFIKHGLDDHSIVQSDHPACDYSKSLQLASVQTITRRKNKPMVDLVIVDEAHCMYKSLTALIHAWDAIPFIGLSATPWAKGMGKVYDDLIIVKTTQELVDEGFLCDFTVFGSEAIDMKGVRTTAGDYNQKDLEKKVNKPKIVGNVIDTWLRLGENRQTVCFAVNVAHSKAIVDEFMANGVPAAHIDAYTKDEDREEIMKRYEMGVIKILSNVGITTKGWDSPKTSCLILARPTKSLMLYIQMVGRVLRTHPEKDNALILDHGGNTERLGFATDTLPEYLCNGDKDEIAERKKKEKKEPLPKACEKCFHISTAYTCPVCGHEPEKMPNVEAVEGELKRLSKVSMQDKSRWFSELLGYARSKGYQDGWASHKYKEKFGVWPAKKTGVHAKTPGEEVLKYINHLNIKNKFRKEGKMHLMKPVSGYVYSAQHRVDGELQVRVEKNGHFQGWARQTPEIMEFVNEN